VRTNDPTLVNALQEYQRQQIYNSTKISELLLKEHGIKMRYMYCSMDLNQK
jgi:hypothetical protein